MKTWVTTTVSFLAWCAHANGRSISVEHSFGASSQFTYRGSAEIVFDPSRAAPPSATIEPVKLYDSAQMEELIANDGLYIIRFATGESSAQHVVAAVPACQLRLASFREEITLHVDKDGLIMGVDYKAPVGPLASTRDCTKMPVPESYEVASKIVVVRAASAQSVPLQVLANNPPPGLANLKENTGTKDAKATGSQSMLVRYWYIFVPCLLLYMFSTSAPEQGGQAASAPSGGR